MSTTSSTRNTCAWRRLSQMTCIGKAMLYVCLHAPQNEWNWQADYIFFSFCFNDSPYFPNQHSCSTLRQPNLDNSVARVWPDSLVSSLLLSVIDGHSTLKIFTYYLSWIPRSLLNFFKLIWCMHREFLTNQLVKELWKSVHICQR